MNEMEVTNKKIAQVVHLNYITLCNLTAHVVNVMKRDIVNRYGYIISKDSYDDYIENKEKFNIAVIPPSGIISRCAQTVAISESIDNIDFSLTEFGDIDELPEPIPNVYYIVSRIVKTASPDRNDLIVPNELIKDDEGHVLGCLSLSIN